VPFGTLNVTSLVLQIKDSGANVLWLPLTGATNSAIMAGLNQAGGKMKVIINATGYGQVLLNDTSVIPAAQGAWFLATGVPSSRKPSQPRLSNQHWQSMPTTPAFLTSLGTRDGVGLIS
jgi:ABC-type branched-subunit amino acid transport system substrate-binding protein